MQKNILNILRCPKSGEALYLEDIGLELVDGEIKSGWLVSEKQKIRYPIINYVPRFVDNSNYADNFGMQWNHFKKTQLDSYTGQPITANRFWAATKWTPELIKDQWVLDVGCGSGRFAEVALKAGAQVVAIDYSSAVDACLSNLNAYPNFHVMQADIYALPFEEGKFSFVYSLGVLQHTPNVALAFSALPPMLRSGGRLCADFYWSRLSTIIHPKYVLRPITKRIPKQKLFELLVVVVPMLLTISQCIGRVPLIGKYLKRIIPVADYTNIYPLNWKQLQEWALLDTFDMLAPAYDKPQSISTVRGWMHEANLVDVQVEHVGHLVARGTKGEP